MKALRRLPSLMASLFLAVDLTSCTPTPASTGTCTCGAAAKASGAAAAGATATSSNVFGIPEAKLGRAGAKAKAAAAVVVASTAAAASAAADTAPSGSTDGDSAAASASSASALRVRGGELHEPETLADVEALVLDAAGSGRLVVIDFTASWCGPCKAIAPLYKELSEEYDDVVFLKVDVDENPDTAAKYSVSAMPTFLYIQRGVVVDRLMGANPAKLREMIEDHM